MTRSREQGAASPGLSHTPAAQHRREMARGYTEDPDPGYRPNRPQRSKSTRGYEDLAARGYTAHYAESPVIQTAAQQQEPHQPPRTLPRRAASRSQPRNSTLPRSEAAASRSASRASRARQQQVSSQVTRSRSWGARPAGVVVYNRHGEPVEAPAAIPASKPPSTIGVGYRPSTALRYALPTFNVPHHISHHCHSQVDTEERG